MKYTFVILLALCVFYPPGAEAARLFSSGCELQLLAEDGGPGEVEWIASGSQSGALSISTSVFNSGLASCRINTTAGNYEYMLHDVVSGTSASSFYARAYVYINTAPGGTSQFITVGSSSEDEGAVGIGSDMVLRLYSDDMSTVRDTAGAALSTDTWYRIEWNYDSGGNSEVRVDGVQVLLDAAHDGDAIAGFLFGSLGINFGGQSGDFYFDDIAINDTSGGSQTSWPGAGSIVHMQPNVAGDNSGCTAGNVASVDEVTPDDGTTICTLTTDVGGDILDVNTESSSSAGLDSYDTVTLVQVGVRESVASAASAGWNLRIKSASGGSVTSGSATTHDDATYKTNGDATPRNYTLTSYTDPTTGIAWTPTGTNSLDEMQIGITTTDGNPDVRISTLWALVEYVDGSPPGVTEQMRIRAAGSRITIKGGKIILRSN